MPSEFRKASDVINALFSGFDSEGMRQSNAFVRGWSEAVGEKIASHSRVIDVDRGVLTVRITSYNVCYTKLLRRFPSGPAGDSRC